MTTEANSRFGRICAYCGEAVLTGREKPEHVIPRALGSSCEIWTVCDGCNEWAGREVDEPFLRDPYVLMWRAHHDIRDPRRPRRIPSPFQRGTTEDGIEIVMDVDGTPRILNGRIIEGPGEGEFTIIAGDRKEHDRLLRKIKQRAEAQGKRVEHGEPTSGEFKPNVKGRGKVAPWRWRREVAKMALGIASDVLPERWRESDDAVRLRAWMRDPDALPVEHCPHEAVPGSPLELLFPKPHHGAMFQSSDAGSTVLTIVLFGEIAFRIGVDTAGSFGPPATAWLLDPKRPNANGQTTMQKLIMDATVRIAGE